MFKSKLFYHEWENCQKLETYILKIHQNRIKKDVNNEPVTLNVIKCKKNKTFLFYKMLKRVLKRDVQSAPNIRLRLQTQFLSHWPSAGFSAAFGFTTSSRDSSTLAGNVCSAAGERRKLGNGLTAADPEGSRVVCRSTFSPTFRLSLPGGGVACCAWEAERMKAAGEPGSSWQAAPCCCGITADGFDSLWINCSSERCSLLLSSTSDRGGVAERLTASFRFFVVTELKSAPSLILLLWRSAAAMRLRMLGLSDWRCLLALPKVDLTSCRVTFTWPLPEFESSFCTGLSSVSIWFSTLKLSPAWGFVVFSFTFESRILILLCLPQLKLDSSVFFCDSFVIWSNFAASIEARRLFFFGFEEVGGGGGGDENKVVGLVWSATFCFFLADAVLNEGDTCNGFGDAAILSSAWRQGCLVFRPSMVVLDSAAAGWADGVWEDVTSRAVWGVFELVAALQWGRWLFSLLKVFPQCGHTSVGGNVKLVMLFKQYMTPCTLGRHFGSKQRL